MRLKVASRKSDLARWQAVQVARALEQAPERPSIEFLFKASLGDQNLDLPLAGMGAKGVFTEDFYADLTDGIADMVVHSWKDLPVETRAETHIAMTLPRADVRDVVLIPEEVWAKTQETGTLKVLTSSPRRTYNLEPVLPQLLPGTPRVEFHGVRGNVPTRLRKMREEGGALVLAKAGLDRLLAAEQGGFLQDSVRALIKDCRFLVLPLSLNPPAPAQGALAVEVMRDNETVNRICSALTDEATFKCVEQEREILRRYGGGCHQKIGVAVIPRPFGVVRALRGITDSGEILNEWRIENETPWSRAQSPEHIYPQENREWFKREPLVTEPARDEEAFFVARADAWPEGWTTSSDQLVWTAGVQTWIKLAARGIFVNGCNDSLGESEAARIELLAGHDPVWCRLSHQGAPQTERGLATYRLVPKADAPDLRGKTHFFWMSRSSFERARELFPREIAEGLHSCGPGHTWEYLREAGLKNPVKVFMGLDQFLHETLP